MRWFSGKEIQKADDFITQHLNCYENNNPNHKNLGFTINHNWTGIGISTHITCNCCGKEKDVTDYGC